MLWIYAAPVVAFVVYLQALRYGSDKRRVAVCVSGPRFFFLDQPPVPGILGLLPLPAARVCFFNSTQDVLLRVFFFSWSKIPGSSLLHVVGLAKPPCDGFLIAFCTFHASTLHQSQEVRNNFTTTFLRSGKVYSASRAARSSNTASAVSIAHLAAPSGVRMADAPMRAKATKKSCRVISSIGTVARFG